MLERYGDNYYYYNEEGIRIAKEENGLIHKYYVEDNVIHKEEIRNKSSNQLVKEIYYYYDETGISAFRINSNIYYYLKDLTGLILGIYNSDGVIVARYVYDAFGNHKVCDGSYNANTNDSFIGNINPFRYKSYYYDKESNLYYLNSRYYSPIYYRFISIDDIDYLKSESINGINLYTYCGNDPINYTDPSGHFSLPNWAKWVIGGVAFAGAVALTIISGGSLAPVFIGMGVSIASIALIEGAISAYNGKGFWSGFVDGAADGAMRGGIFSLVSAGIGAIKYTRGFRVVGLNEYDDIARTDKFASDGFSEEKYFWSSKSSARAFASKMGMADDTYRIIGSRISRSGLKNALSKGTAYYFPYLDDIGRAYFIDIVNQLVSKIWTVF